MYMKHGSGAVIHHWLSGISRRPKGISWKPRSWNYIWHDANMCQDWTGSMVVGVTKVLFINFSVEIGRIYLRILHESSTLPLAKYLQFGRNMSINELLILSSNSYLHLILITLALLPVKGISDFANELVKSFESHSYLIKWLWAWLNDYEHDIILIISVLMI